MWFCDPWKHVICLFHVRKKQRVVHGDVIYSSVLQYIMKEPIKIRLQFNSSNKSILLIT